MAGNEVSLWAKSPLRSPDLLFSTCEPRNWGNLPSILPIFDALGPVSLVANTLKFAEVYRDSKLNVHCSFWHPISRSWVVQEAPLSPDHSLSYSVALLNRLGNSIHPRWGSSHWGCLAWAALCGLLFAHLPFKQGRLESLFCLKMGANILKVPHYPSL